MSPDGSAQTTGRFIDAWTSALDEIEMTIEEAEAILSFGRSERPRPWVPPVVQGPLPASLAGRARALAQRQEEVARGLAQAQVLSRRHTSAIRSMRYEAETTPVYLDTSA